MTERISRYSVVLHHPFDPGGHNGTQPAGTYDVEIVEEQLDSISFIAYRRLSTTISMRPRETGIRPPTMMINSADFEQALADDRKSSLSSTRDRF